MSYMHLNRQPQLMSVYTLRSQMSRLYPCPPSSGSSQVWHSVNTATDCMKWSTNWIVIFSHRGIQASEKRASRSGLVWLPFFSSSIPFLAQCDFFFFHATGWSLNPNLLCSTWKETGYRSFGFSSPSNFWQINSLPHPNTKPPPRCTIGRSYCCIWNTIVL